MNGYVGIGSVVSERCDINSAVVCRGAVLDSGVKCGEYSVIGEKAHIASEAVIGKKEWAYGLEKLLKRVQGFMKT